MRHKLLGAVLAALIVPPVMMLSLVRAAELPRSGQIIAPSQARADDVPNWSGPWVAGTLGYGIQATDIGSLSDLSLATHDFTWGGELGADHRFAGTNLLIGIGCGIEWSNAQSATGSFDRQWGCWGRGGVLLTPASLLYGKVGYTSVHGEFVIPSFTSWEGLTLGAGLELAFADKWFIGLEGDWIKLGGDSSADAQSNEYAAKLRIGRRF